MTPWEGLGTASELWARPGREVRGRELGELPGHLRPAAAVAVRGLSGRRTNWGGCGGGGSLQSDQSAC